MGFSLAPVLASILTEFKIVVAPVMEIGILKLYFRYVDDILVKIKLARFYRDLIYLTIIYGLL